MNAADLLTEVRAMGMVLTPNGERLRVWAPRGVLTADLCARLTAAKPSLLALLNRERTTRPVLHFQLPDHSRNAWATYLGAPGQSVDQLRTSICERWPHAEIRQPQWRTR